MDHRAAAIIERLAQSLDTPYQGSSSMTPSVYDTAWVAMVAKVKQTPGDGEVTYWLFPECFQIVLESQCPHGGFGASVAQVDSILNTMAALLALSKHRTNAHVRGCPALPDLVQRIEQARDYLQGALHDWDVWNTVHVGFEILVPSLLRMLEQEGFNFTFPGREALMTRKGRKEDKIKLAVLYSREETTLLHSLEAFVGRINFNKTSHFLKNGSMLGSPSSTAAYLINASQWDCNAEEYLRFIVAAGKGHVSSAFPISVFEVSWVLSTLLGSGYTAISLGLENVSKLADFLELQLQEHGVTGFAPGILPDADDTAKSLQSLHLLGRTARYQPMIETFETLAHFKTYHFETSESFSANCNILIALLGSHNPSLYISQISKALGFLRQAWYNNTWGDKWNIEPQYSMMLLAEALLGTIRLWNASSLSSHLSNLIEGSIPPMTLQIVIRTLTAQFKNGSWKDSAEITSYALLTLKKLASLPWAVAVFAAKLDESIQDGTKFLQLNQSSWDTPEMIWVEKVTYGSRVLAEAYCLAAMKAEVQSEAWDKHICDLYQVPDCNLNNLAQFFGHQ